MVMYGYVYYCMRVDFLSAHNDKCTTLIIFRGSPAKDSK